MRKALLAALLFAAVPLFAQERGFRLSVFATELSYTRSEATGDDFDADLGAALEYRWNQKWALELSLSREENRVPVVRIDQNGNLVPSSQRVETWPADLMLNYQFANDTRWKPYLGAGLHYVSGRRTLFGEYGNSVAPQVGGGVHFMMTPALSLRFDAKYSTEASPGENFRPSVGLGWRF